MRKLATVRKITDIRPIEGADAIEVAQVDGWSVVIKKNEYKIGDLVVYIEIDSFVSHELAPFLSKGKVPSTYNGVKGERLRSIKLRGQISQGLILPFNTIMSSYDGECSSTDWNLGDDVTELLGIQKWERPIPVQLQGQIAGDFPTHLVPKTDQERAQNLAQEIFLAVNSSTKFELTEKLDGSSLTIICHEGEYRVCSRNLELKRDEKNAFWRAAISLEDTLMSYHRMTKQNFALQGELVSHGIQGNPYKFDPGVTKFFVFDIYDIDKQKYVESSMRRQFCQTHNINHVPVNVETEYVVCFPTWTPKQLVDVVLKMADGKSVLNPNVLREGVVFKQIGGTFTFKAISNDWLLKTGE